MANQAGNEPPLPAPEVLAEMALETSNLLREFVDLPDEITKLKSDKARTERYHKDIDSLQIRLTQAKLELKECTRRLSNLEIAPLSSPAEVNILLQARQSRQNENQPWNASVSIAPGLDEFRTALVREAILSTDFHHIGVQAAVAPAAGAVGHAAGAVGHAAIPPN